MIAIEMKTDSRGRTDTGGAFIWAPNDWEVKNLKPDTRYACYMVEIPDGYRLATEEDKCGGRFNGRRCYWGDGWKEAFGQRWEERIAYIVPIADKNAELRERLRKAEEEVAAVRKELTCSQ